MLTINERWRIISCFTSFIEKKCFWAFSIFKYIRRLFSSSFRFKSNRVLNPGQPFENKTKTKKFF